MPKSLTLTAIRNTPKGSIDDAGRVFARNGYVQQVGARTFIVQNTTTHRKAMRVKRDVARAMYPNLAIAAEAHFKATNG
jgi:hypothetical protein